MKRITAILLCFLLVFFVSACGSVVSPSPAATAAVPQTPEPTPAPDYSLQAAEAANTCVVNMFTLGYDDARVTRFDFNSDGVEDWLVFKQTENPQGAWLTLDGSEPAYCPVILYDSSAAGDIHLYYSAPLGTAVLNKFYSTAGYSESVYYGFDGFVGAELAYFKSSWDEGDVWQLQGVMCSQEEMDAYIASLSLSEPGESVSVSGYREFSLDLPSEALGDAARKLDALSFASCLASGDIDGDGQADYMFRLSREYYGVECLGELYLMSGSMLTDYDSYAAGTWTDCCLVLSSNSGSPKGCVVFDHLDYEARFREAVFASGAELAGLGADGQYRLRLYSDLMSETAGGWLAYAELMQRVTVTDEALRASLGDEYDVSYGDGYERIYAEEADFIYYRHSEDEPWTVCYMSELAATDRIASGVVFVPDTAGFDDWYCETMFGIAREVATLPELFDMPGDFPSLYSEEVLVDVSGGEITLVTLPYSP